MKSCIYPGSFDPITLGHLDVIERAAGLFDKVYVAIGTNSSKVGLFTVEERIKLIKKASNHIPNVEVVSFSGLLADYVYELGVKVVIKGVRNFQDFDYERLLHEIGVTQQRGIETFTVFSKSQLSHVSSSSAKELCKYNGLSEDYVPFCVKEAMDWKMHSRRVIGITGEIGMGKSAVVGKIMDMQDWSPSPFWNNTHAKNVDLDLIGHDILHTRTEPVYVQLRQDVIKEFSLPTGELIDRKALGHQVFGSKHALDTLNSMMRVPMLTRVRKEMDFKGLVILNGALLVEAGFLGLCNNNIAVVTSTKEQQKENLKKRGLDEEQIQRRLSSQLSTEKKKHGIVESILKHRHGSHSEIVNDYDPDKFNKLVRFFVEKQISELTKTTL